MGYQPPDIDLLLQSNPCDDPRIVEAIVEQYRSAIYRLAFSILYDADEAEDAVQDAFVAATMNLDRYQPGTNFKAWLYTITVNTCRGYLRRSRARSALAGILQTMHLTLSGSSSVEESTLDHADCSQLWAAVDQLGEKQRMVVILRIRHELTIPEIAQILQVNEKTIYTRLYDAFRNLRGLLITQTDTAIALANQELTR